MKWVRVAVVPTALVAGAAALSVTPSDAATNHPCLMRVTVDRVSNVTYASGVERDKYNVKVTLDGRTQSAEVQRMVMPSSAAPRLVTKKLGSVGQLSAQLDSKKGRRGIAAVNGDFFWGQPIQGQSVLMQHGPSVSRGRPVRMGPDRMRVVGVDKDGKPFDGQVNVGGTVTYGSNVFDIDSLNWHFIRNGDVTVYTGAWSDVKVAKRPAGAVEWLIKKNKIADVRTGAETGRTVQPRTRIIAFGRDHAAVARKAKVGSPVTVAVRQDTTTGVTLREAVGRFHSLVEGGEVYLSCRSEFLYARPRTTVGWDANGNWMTLTVPGSGYDRNGMRIGGLGLAHEANVAKALGFVEASELDGGGSTTAVIRRADGNWDRVDGPDGIWQRPIPNSLIWVKPVK